MNDRVNGTGKLWLCCRQYSSFMYYWILKWNHTNLKLVEMDMIKGNLRSKKKLSSNERAWKMQKKTSHHRPQCAKWFSRYSISKSGIWTRWTTPFCRFSALFSLKYDVTDAMLQHNEKMKVQCLRSLLFDFFETLQTVRTWQRKFASFQISLLWQPESNYCLLLKNKRSIVWAIVMFKK